MATGSVVGQEQERTKIEGEAGTEAIGSPISNEAYNIVAALHAKLEGLEAYRKYSKDANAEMWRELTAAEVSSVQKLVSELERLFQEGKFRLGEPGQSAH